MEHIFPLMGSMVWEIDGVSTTIFEAYLKALSNHHPKEFKIIIIDNAGFYSTKNNLTIPENVYLLRIPPYSPELNLCEQIWKNIKQKFKNQTLKTMGVLKQWLNDTVLKMKPEQIKSITSNHHYLILFLGLNAAQ